ncbi:MAG: helix-turn-helix transcriptional regulator [Alphaproteobacteria bacterium]|nr:helix-turn-helix transcriptional regulator [Alphaproteobacteria bacterium]
MSQLDLALEASISSRHLSFVETGRAQPSREMILHLSERLDIPLREQNILLLSAGYAAVFPERPLDDPALSVAREAVEVVLTGHEPYPAIAVDRHWQLVAANNAVAPLLTGADPKLFEPPINVLRLSLHPDGVAPRIANLAEWRGHVLARLRQQIDVSADPVLAALHDELAGYSAPRVEHRVDPRRPSQTDGEFDTVVVPIQLVSEHGMLAFFSTTTVFGTPIDVTLAELAIEAFFPANAATAEILRRLTPDARG